MGTKLIAGSEVRAIVPNDFDGAWQIARAVCEAGMAPRGLDTPEKAMVAIMHGMEVGLTPMAALQSIAVVNGRPTIWGDGALGLVQSSGLMESFKEAIEGEGDNRKAICVVKRKGNPETTIGEFTVAQAKQAKLWGKTGPWTDYPERMLKMRARGFALRDGFSDVLRGLGIAEEVHDTQMRDITPDRPKPPAPPAPPKPTASTIEAGTVELDENQFDLGLFMTELEEAIAWASDEATIEEVWTEKDPEATLESAGHGDMIGTAVGMKQRRLAMLSTASAG